MVKNRKYIIKRTEALHIGVVRHCTFCEKEIKGKEDVSHTEDAEITHSKCLQDFEQQWKDRDEALDLMGY
jgi:hypothetical protein